MNLTYTIRNLIIWGFCFIFSSANAQIITKGLIGYYPFNGNVNDESGNINNGTIMNGTLLIPDRFGNSNSAYYFDGIDDYINIPSDSFKTIEYSYSLWANVNTLPFSGEQSILLSIGDAFSPYSDQTIALPNGYLSSRYGWSCASYYNNSSGHNFITNVTNLPSINNWYHLVVTRNNNELKLYINGLMVGFTSTLGTNPYYGSTTNAIIGARNNLQYHFHGSIDDIYIFNRALSESEVLALYYDCSAIDNCKNLISGNIFNDANNNCTKDGGDSPLKNWLVKIEPGPVYGISDSNGYYSAWVDTGDYTITEIIPNKLWNSACPPTHTVHVAGIGDTVANNDFANTGISCPLMWVDISTPLLRNCPTHDWNYVVNYCNNGTAIANNAYIHVTFTSDFTITGSTLPWTSVTGTTYRFDVGNLNPGECGGFDISYQLDCDNSLGQTLCVKAKIFPDTICVPVDSVWDKSSLKVDGECAGDSVRFVVLNHGSNMTGNTPYRIYVNDSLVIKNNLQLQSNDSMVILFAACGNTIRLEADQRPGHPGHSHPRVTVEGCGSSCGTVTYGYVLTTAPDDEDANVAIDCQQIRGSFDPNEKLVTPSGITANKYIASIDELEYQINFQNTGNDTAFIVRVRDTLASYLDISTIQTGASSHPYTMRVFGNNILEWTFENINLLDSFSNEAASHGYVKFKIKQTANNPEGTVINNSGSIYFDFNAPVKTEKVTVTVNDLKVLGIKKLFAIEKKSEIKIFPNPSEGNLRIMIDDLRMENAEIKIYDVLGNNILQSKIVNLKSEIILNAPSGIYFYKIFSGREFIETGKLVIQR